ncbi:hypothetical protein LCGC14_0313130 [marine sediment metagenome]|uniref:Uncharacterized protein n=1 Tax=marine sediment metagenome TaxID=412755 RepID=A0A0F9W8P0_9ZZZZ
MEVLLESLLNVLTILSLIWWVVLIGSAACGLVLLLIGWVIDGGGT